MRIKNLIAGTLVIGFLAMFAVAQDAADKPAKGEHGRRGRGEGGPGARHGQFMADQQVERMTKELTLTTEQQDKVRKLVIAHQDQMKEVMGSAMKENADKLKELREQIDAAKAANDMTKARELETKRRKLLGEDKMEPMREKLIADISGVLTAEQKPKFDKIKGDLFGMRVDIQRHPEMLMKAIESLKLPAEREQKIRAIMEEAKPKAKDGAKARGPRARGEGMRMTENPEVGKKMMALLSPEEQAKVKEWRPEHPMGMGMRHGGEGQDAAKDGKARKGHKRGAGSEKSAAEQPK